MWIKATADVTTLGTSMGLIEHSFTVFVSLALKYPWERADYKMADQILEAYMQSVGQSMCQKVQGSNRLITFVWLLYLLGLWTQSRRYAMLYCICE